MTAEEKLRKFASENPMTAAEIGLSVFLREVDKQRELLKGMIPVVKAAIKWGELPTFENDEEMTEEDTVKRLEVQLELSCALSGKWEELPNGCWRKKTIGGVG